MFKETQTMGLPTSWTPLIPALKPQFRLLKAGYYSWCRNRATDSTNISLQRRQTARTSKRNADMAGLHPETRDPVRAILRVSRVHNIDEFEAALGHEPDKLLRQNLQYHWFLFAPASDFQARQVGRKDKLQRKLSRT